MLELGGAVVSVLDRLDREDVRLLPLRRVIASAVGLRWVRRQYSPLVAMHHMILRVRRKIFEITMKPNTYPFPLLTTRRIRLMRPLQEVRDIGQLRPLRNEEYFPCI